jgi:hypothetical protein
VYYNNPVKVANNERKILWPDVAEAPPDIILSVGTGMNGQKIKEELRNDSTETSAVRKAGPQSDDTFNRLKENVKTKAPRPQPFRRLSNFLRF